MYIGNHSSSIQIVVKIGFQVSGVAEKRDAQTNRTFMIRNLQNV